MPDSVLHSCRCLVNKIEDVIVQKLSTSKLVFYQMSEMTIYISELCRSQYTFGFQMTEEESV